MSRRILLLPYEALDSFQGPDLLLVVSLYRRADACRWRPFPVSQRGLGVKFGISGRRVKAVLTDMAGLGLASVITRSRAITDISIERPGMLTGGVE